MMFVTCAAQAAFGAPTGAAGRVPALAGATMLGSAGIRATMTDPVEVSADHTSQVGVFASASVRDPTSSVGDSGTPAQSGDRAQCTPTISHGPVRQSARWTGREAYDGAGYCTCDCGSVWLQYGGPPLCGDCVIKHATQCGCQRCQPPLRWTPATIPTLVVATHLPIRVARGVSTQEANLREQAKRRQVTVRNAIIRAFINAIPRRPYSGRHILTRAELQTLLLAAGIESNPGPIFTWAFWTCLSMVAWLPFQIYAWVAQLYIIAWSAVLGFTLIAGAGGALVGLACRPIWWSYPIFSVLLSLREAHAGRFSSAIYSPAKMLAYTMVPWSVLAVYHIALGVFQTVAPRYAACAFHAGDHVFNAFDRGISVLIARYQNYQSLTHQSDIPLTPAQALRDVGNWLGSDAVWLARTLSRVSLKLRRYAWRSNVTCMPNQVGTGAEMQTQSHDAHATEIEDIEVDPPLPSEVEMSAPPDDVDATEIEETDSDFPPAMEIEDIQVGSLPFSEQPTGGRGYNRTTGTLFWTTELFKKLQNKMSFTNWELVDPTIADTGHCTRDTLRYVHAREASGESPAWITDLPSGVREGAVITLVKRLADEMGAPVGLAALDVKGVNNRIQDVKMTHLIPAPQGTPTVLMLRRAQQVTHTVCPVARCKIVRLGANHP